MSFTKSLPSIAIAGVIGIGALWLVNKLGGIGNLIPDFNLGGNGVDDSLDRLMKTIEERDKQQEALIDNLAMGSLIGQAPFKMPYVEQDPTPPPKRDPLAEMNPLLHPDDFQVNKIRSGISRPTDIIDVDKVLNPQDSIMHWIRGEEALMDRERERRNTGYYGGR